MIINDKEILRCGTFVARTFLSINGETSASRGILARPPEGLTCRQTSTGAGQQVNQRLCYFWEKNSWPLGHFPDLNPYQPEFSKVEKNEAKCLCAFVIFLVMFFGI